MESIRKYPRTPHLRGSRLQPGDHDLERLDLSDFEGRDLVVEEKVDGANAGVSLAQDGSVRLQSRGHFLTGGPRERHFSLFKTWASVHEQALRELLGQRYVLYGEWLYARHTIFYDALPHYFLEFDVYDVEGERFLTTTQRRALLQGSPVQSVPVLHTGPIDTVERLRQLLTWSRFKTPDWKRALRQAATTDENGLWGSVERAVAETDPSDLAEGLYLKVEDDEGVQARFKWVRGSFTDAVQRAESHWLARPILPNVLAEDASMW